MEASLNTSNVSIWSSFVFVVKNFLNSVKNQHFLTLQHKSVVWLLEIVSGVDHMQENVLEQLL